MKNFIPLLLFLLIPMISFGQKKVADVVQVSGLILTDSEDELLPVSFATVSVVGTDRGTYASFKGFFSIVVRKGEVLRFSAVGFEPHDFTVPDTLVNNRYSMVQLMTTDVVNLPESVIFPWPDKDYFGIEFLAMDVENEMEERAKANLAKERLDPIRKAMVMDAGENQDYYLRQHARSFYHIGQVPPMKIFDPFAWGKFFKAWKNGDFKRKD